LATKILKTVINHTRNIQSKDIERMPYPYWVSEENKKNVIERVKSIIINKKNTEEDTEFIENLFQFNS
jgi:protein-arginine kinase